MNVKDKLLLLQEYLSVPTAAEFLSNAFSERLTEADVFKFALDGHLKLSIYFPNMIRARRGEIVEFENVEWIEDGFHLLYKKRRQLIKNAFCRDQAVREFVPRRFLKSLIVVDPKVVNIEGEEKFIPGRVVTPDCLLEPLGRELSSSLPCDWDPDEQGYFQKILNYYERESLRFLTFCQPYDEIDGVWELPIFESVYCEIKRRHHELMGLSYQNELKTVGIYVENIDGSKMYRLNEKDTPEINFDDPDFFPYVMIPKSDSFLFNHTDEEVVEYKVEKKPYLDNWEFIAADLPDESVSVVWPQAIPQFDSFLFDLTDEEIEEHKDEIRSYMENWEFIAADLPADSVLVVRPQALIDFRDRMYPAFSQIETSSEPLPDRDDNMMLENDLIKKTEWKTGKMALCKAYGVRPKSFTAVRNKVKKLGLKFSYDPRTREVRLSLSDLNEILADKWKRKKK